MSVNGDSSIAKKLHTWLNSWADAPTSIAFDDFSKDPPCMTFQPMSGTLVERKYIDGSFIGVYPFAVSMRISGDDTAERIDAHATLSALGEWAKDSEPPELGEGRTVTEFDPSTPAKTSVYDNGAEDYQIIITMKYRQKGGNGS